MSIVITITVTILMPLTVPLLLPQCRVFRYDDTDQ